METTTLGLSHFWSQADCVIRFTAYLLLAISIASWFLIVWKAWAWLRVRRATMRLEEFWGAASIDAAIAGLKPHDREWLFEAWNLRRLNLLHPDKLPSGRKIGSC